ncbi:methyl-accepting chemotaxis sensory transducer with Cache sensor [Micromonospora pattaloongensis]|uniref:Methyl-accepting chemotaxis sensory transducer with Cache sensor n=1 Tax=Micromonospora pattaloongensis TaxID=405436 RepID=A0A1H3NX08_9ACTN|nr:methyl-accepting chemotaxis protein [Micromonospora pattaloongensis]SDY93368.1 methyl-accepting chemotaxis sensory transducer with Cache sensor [Micromonospora pattaloongensis]
MRRLLNVGIFVKLAVVAGVAIAGLLAMGAARLAEVAPMELESRKAKVRALVESATSVIAGYHAATQNGTMTTEQAQRAALTALKAMRYGADDYFFVNDMHPVMVMHPMKPELDGKDLSTNADPNGKLLFVEFVKVVRAEGAGFVDYQWPKPGHDAPVDKLTYVAGFEPWGWVVGTGIYIDDMHAAIAAHERDVMVQTGAIMLGVAVVLVLVGLSITRPVRSLTLATRRLADGQLDVALPSPGRGELGRMSAALGVLRDGLAERQALAEERDRMRAQAEAEKRRAADDVADRLEATVDTVAGRLKEAVEAMQRGAAELGDTTGQLVGTVREISHLAGESSDVAGRAAAEATDASGTVNGLTTAADTIGGVVEVIRKVAAQTNLLALNATIEAARAGEIGKGFAVVAGEVKELAQQSSRATDEIAREIESIQSTSQEAARVMDRMADTVERLGSSTREVAAAIAGGDSEGASVRGSAEATGQVAHRIQQLSGELSAEADRLRGDFGVLLSQLRQG